MDEFQAARQSVLNVIRGAEAMYTPREVIELLMEQGIGEDMARVALWNLVDRKEIKLDNRQLRLYQRASSSLGIVS